MEICLDVMSKTSSENVESIESTFKFVERADRLCNLEKLWNHPEHLQLDLRALLPCFSDREQISIYLHFCVCMGTH
jgi:hypothetical protein